ncbi:Smr/MutS family protein [Phenylobacterium sp.]|uniref:Smr/MutS family protein n=1 Tax=Phenylobacterium sp. TaxID=1871053 RepID=UPI00356288C5
MKRPLKPEERHIWGMVAATVHPLPGRATPKAETADAIPAPARAEAAAKIGVAAAPRPKPAKPRAELHYIEPNRKHRIARERDPIGARLDMHGLDQDRARGVLERFLTRAWDEGFRAVLIITGKGVQGDGILKRRTPEWLAAPHLAHMVAGISDAARHHGGGGALYVALKRKARG